MFKDFVFEQFEKLREFVEASFDDFKIVLKKNVRLRSSKGRYAKIGSPSS